MIVAMKKILIAGRAVDRDRLLVTLRNAGVVQAVPVDAERARPPAEVVQQLERARRAALVLEQVQREHGLARVAVGGGGLPCTGGALVDAILDLDAEGKRLREQLESAGREAAEAAPWGRIDRSALAALAAAGVVIQAWTAPAGRALPPLPAGVVALALTGAGGRDCLVTASRQRLDGLEGFAGTELPARDHPTVVAEIETATARRRAVTAQLQALIGSRGLLEGHQRDLERQRRYGEVEAGLLADGPIVVLAGWVPAPRAEEPGRAFAAAGLPVAVKISDPADDDQPPTLLEYPRWMQPIQALFDFFKIFPGYREFDVGPVYLIAMLIFTGMLFADAGYSLLMFISLAVLYRPLLRRGAEPAQLHLALSLFGAGSIYGMLTGSYFGVNVQSIPVFGPVLGLVAITRLADTNDFLKWLAFLLGTVHMSVAHLMKVARLYPDARFLAETGWLCYLWGMFLLVCQLTLPGAPRSAAMIPLFIAGSVLVVLFTAAPGTGIGWRLAEGVKTILLGAAGPLSDVISYVRLVAVAMAGAALASSFNGMAAAMGSWWLGVPVLVAGHGLNLALCLIALLAHGVRLNLLEFGNHLGIEWLGRKYAPFGND